MVRLTAGYAGSRLGDTCAEVWKYSASDRNVRSPPDGVCPRLEVLRPRFRRRSAGAMLFYCLSSGPGHSSPLQLNFSRHGWQAGVHFVLYLHVLELCELGVPRGASR